MARPVYIVDGSRTPFLKARSGPGPFTPVDLAVQCGRPLLARQPFAPDAFDQVILGCVNVIADEMNPARVAALRLGMGEAMVAFTVQINCGSGMQSIDTGYRYIREGNAEPDSGRRRGSAEPRAAGVAAAGRALVRRLGRRERRLCQGRGGAESPAGLFQAGHRPRARADRSDHRTQHGADRRGGRPSVRHHAGAVGRLCRRKPQAARQRAGAGLAEGRGRDRVRARRQILRSRRRRAAGLHAGDAGKTEAGVRAAVGPGHRRQFIADHRRRVVGHPRVGRRGRQTRPDAEGRHRRQPMVGARSQHHGPRPGAVGDRTAEAQQAVAAGHRDLGAERSLRHAGAGLPRGLEGREILPRDSGPRRRGRRDRSRQSSMSTAAPSASAIPSAAAATASCCIWSMP